jgi:hypothetical protein
LEFAITRGALSTVGPAKSNFLSVLATGIDYSKLERDYPFGFLIFRGDKPDKRQDDLAQQEIEWDCAIQTTRIPGNRLSVNLAIKKIHLRRQGTLLGDSNFNNLSIPNSVGARFTVHNLERSPNRPNLYFEILDNHDTRPIYVIGFAYPKD